MARPEPFVTHELDVALEDWGPPSSERVRWRTLLSADRTPTAALTLGVAELAPHQTLELRTHRHAQPEAYYVLAGTGVVSIDGAEHPVRAGSTVFIPGSAAHGSVNTGDEPLRILYVFPTDSFGDVEYERPDR